MSLCGIGRSCSVATWALDGDEPLTAQFSNGVGLADVVAAIAAFAASLLGLMALNFFIGAALGENWEMAGD
jgi:hypothetical protein